MRCDVSVQLMYFCYGLGALLSSLVAMPFLSDVRCGGLLNTSARAPPAVGVAARAATQQRTEFFSEVQYAYWIFSGVQLPVPLLVGILAFKYGEVLPSDSTSAAAACELKGPAASTAGASSALRSSPLPPPFHVMSQHIGRCSVHL